jgi:hypothetical protein
MQLISLSFGDVAWLVSDISRQIIDTTPKAERAIKKIIVS